MEGEKEEIMSIEKDSKKTNLSEKNTKAKIWQAYNEILQKVEGKPIEAKLEQKESVVNNILKNLASLKLEIGQNLDKIGNELLSDLNDLQDSRHNLNREKQQMLENLSEQKHMLETEWKKIKNQWEETKKIEEQKLDEQIREKKIAHTREENEYQYNLSIERRKENNEYNEKKIAREKALHEREMNIGNHEEEISQMEKEISLIPKKIENTIKETEIKITKELNQKHSIELNELKLSKETEAKISQMKIINLETTVKSQNQEIETIRRQLSDANKQLKEIAVSAIESRRPISNEKEEK